TSGVDIGINWMGDKTDLGRFSASLNGTLVLAYDRQFGPLEPFRSNLGVFLNDQVIQRWRHRMSFGWDLGTVGLTLANSYSSGYRDQNTNGAPFNRSPFNDRNVGSYSLWDLSVSYTGVKNLTLSGRAAAEAGATEAPINPRPIAAMATPAVRLLAFLMPRS
nr:TonB-dependent receptor [Solirubrobacterales bacterium]